MWCNATYFNLHLGHRVHHSRLSYAYMAWPKLNMARTQTYLLGSRICPGFTQG